MATGQYIPPSGVEVISVPGGGYLLIRVAGVFHQEVHLVVEVAAADAIHVAEVGLIHSNEQVVLLVVAGAELPGGIPAAGDIELRQLSPSWRVDRIA